MICDSCGMEITDAVPFMCPHGPDGLVAGGTVQPWAHDKYSLARIAESSLRERLQKTFADFPLGNLKTGAEHDAIRQTKFKTWIQRGLISTPDGGLVADGLASMGWQIHIELAVDAHPLAKSIAAELPSHFMNFEVHVAE